MSNNLGYTQQPKQQAIKTQKLWTWSFYPFIKRGSPICLMLKTGLLILSQGEWRNNQHMLCPSILEFQSSRIVFKYSTIRSWWTYAQIRSDPTHWISLLVCQSQTQELWIHKIWDESSTPLAPQVRLFKPDVFSIQRDKTTPLWPQLPQQHSGYPLVYLKEDVESWVERKKSKTQQMLFQWIYWTGIKNKCLQYSGECSVQR